MHEDSGGDDDPHHHCGCGCEEAKPKDPKIAIAGFSVSFLIFISCFIFSFDEKLKVVLFALSALIVGYKVFFAAAKNIFRAHFLDENFLMAVAVIGAFAIGEAAEGALVMLLYFVGSFFEDMAHKKSQKSINSILKLNADYANLIEGESIRKVDPAEVETGELIRILPGELIALDAVIIEGQTDIDQSSITGESAPVSACEGSEIYSGCVNLTGSITAKVLKRYENSTASRLIRLMQESADKKSKTEKFITRFAKVYTPIVIISAILLAFVPPIFSGYADFSVWVYRALTFIVVSCPCALVLSVPMSYFAGLGRASKMGIIIKGSNYLEELNNIGAVVFDKTGTITTGDFKIKEIIPLGDASKKEILSLAAKAESASPHPIAKSIVAFSGEQSFPSAQELPGLGAKADFLGETIICGNERLMKKEGIEIPEREIAGTKVFVAKGKKLLGIIVIADEIKENAKSAIAVLNARGYKTVILTGDNELSARNIADEADVAEVYWELTPERKVKLLQNILNQRNTFGKVCYVGDGINDAPVIKRADVGIAMGGIGSAPAVEAADIVIPTDDLEKIPEAIDIARKTKDIVWQNIVFALSVKAMALILGACGILPLWLSIFADTGVMLLTVLNSLRLIAKR